MKDNDWADCLTNNSARKISPDINRAKSLQYSNLIIWCSLCWSTIQASNTNTDYSCWTPIIETAKERISLITEITEKNCNFVFEDYYTSLLELLQAIAFTQGHNIQNHICVGFYLKDILKRDDLSQIFDDIRYKRNSLTYYGRRMDYETAKWAIEKCKKIIKELNDNFNSN